jgi:hypothetical protein
MIRDLSKELSRVRGAVSERLPSATQTSARPRYATGPRSMASAATDDDKAPTVMLTSPPPVSIRWRLISVLASIWAAPATLSSLGPALAAGRRP